MLAFASVKGVKSGTIFFLFNMLVAVKRLKLCQICNHVLFEFVPPNTLQLSITAGEKGAADKRRNRNLAQNVLQRTA